MNIDDRERWNAQAKAYPRYEAGDNNYEAGMLKRIIDAGVDFTGKNVLDVGCGSGMYTIRIAQTAQSVTALDISDEMLRILAEDAATAGIKNITPVNSDWEDFNPSGKYDVIFAAMTPALFNEQGKSKLLALAKRDNSRIAYMAYSGKQYSNIWGPLYDRYKIKRDFVNEADAMCKWLDGQNTCYTAIPVEGQWVTRHTQSQMQERVAYNHSKHGISLPDNWLELFLDPQSGLYTEVTD